jgi:hypothetical protein
MSATVPTKPNVSVNECVRAIQDGMGSKSYQLTGEGTENEKRDEFDHFLSTADCVLRDTYAHYETLLDLSEDIPEDFVAERGVNVHLYQVLFLLASGAARRILRTPALSTSRDGRKALVLLSTHLLSYPLKCPVVILSHTTL